jgi:hypothetical protein
MDVADVVAKTMVAVAEEAVAAGKDAAEAAATMHAAVAEEAAGIVTVTRSRASSVTSLGMLLGNVGIATPTTKKKRRRRAPTRRLMAWTPTGMAIPVPPITSPVSSTSSQ